MTRPPRAAAPLPVVLAAEDVAALMRVSVKTARAMMREGEVGSAFRRGKRLYVTRKSFEHAIERMARMNGLGNEG